MNTYTSFVRLLLIFSVVYRMDMGLLESSVSHFRSSGVVYRID